MPKRSAGLLLFRRTDGAVEVLLAHPGGPFWARRDEGAWLIPKGEYDEASEEPLGAALREFAEETGCAAPGGPLLPLGEVAQSRAKTVTAYAVEADFDPETLSPGTTEIEWPPRSGRRLVIPEIDRVGWFPLAEAKLKILPGQAAFLDRLAEALSREPGRPPAPRPAP